MRGVEHGQCKKSVPSDRRLWIKAKCLYVGVIVRTPMYGAEAWSIIIIIILLKQDYKVQLANNKIQMAWLTSWLVGNI